MKKTILMCLMALGCLMTAQAQGKYPTGVWQAVNEAKGITAEATIYSKKAKGRAAQYPDTPCNGELSIERSTGYTEYYVLTYTGTKNANGHVFNVTLVDSDMIEVEGKVAIKMVGDPAKVQPYILIKAVSPNMKKRLSNNMKMMMTPAEIEE